EPVDVLGEPVDALEELEAALPLASSASPSSSGAQASASDPTQSHAIAFRCMDRGCRAPVRPATPRARSRRTRMVRGAPLQRRWYTARHADPRPPRPQTAGV